MNKPVYLAGKSYEQVYTSFKEFKTSEMASANNESGNDSRDSSHRVILISPPILYLDLHLLHGYYRDSIVAVLWAFSSSE